MKIISPAENSRYAPHVHDWFAHRIRGRYLEKFIDSLNVCLRNSNCGIGFHIKNNELTRELIFDIVTALGRPKRRVKAMLVFPTLVASFRRGSNPRSQSSASQCATNSVTQAGSEVFRSSQIMTVSSASEMLRREILLASYGLERYVRNDMKIT